MGVGVEETFTVPGTKVDKYTARFAYNSTSNVFVRLNGVPTSPAPGTVNTETYGELRPGADGSQRNVQGGDVIHFITPDATAYASVSLRKIPG